MIFDYQRLYNPPPAASRGGVEPFGSIHGGAGIPTNTHRPPTRQIPAYGGMTWLGAGMTLVGVVRSTLSTSFPRRETFA